MFSADWWTSVDLIKGKVKIFQIIDKQENTDFLINITAFNITEITITVCITFLSNAPAGFSLLLTGSYQIYDMLQCGFFVHINWN